MKRILSLILISILCLSSVTSFGASDNSVDRDITIREDYEF